MSDFVEPFVEWRRNPKKVPLGDMSIKREREREREHWITTK